MDVSKDDDFAFNSDDVRLSWKDFRGWLQDWNKGLLRQLPCRKLVSPDQLRIGRYRTLAFLVDNVESVQL